MSESNIDDRVEASSESLAYAWYMVALCMAAYIFSFMDRYIITLLVEPIKADLLLSDTQFSFIQGFAFAITFAIAGIPIARVADRRSRPLIIVIGICVWSIATAAGGLSRNFWQLFISRTFVGAGEAALAPTAYSMITDSFPKSKLGTALGVFSTGTFVGAGIAFIIGGAVIELINQMGRVDIPLISALKPWQIALIAVSLPGLFIALIFGLTIRDPGRKGVRDEKSQGFSVREVLDYMSMNKRTFLAHYLGFALLALAMHAMMSWAPAYILRNFTALSTSDVGVYLGTIVLIFSTGGVLSSGLLSDYFHRHGYEDSAMRAGTVGGFGLVIPACLFPHMPGLVSSLILLALTLYFCSFCITASAAALQQMGPNQMRAQITALFLICMTMVGITGGTSLVALCTDYLFHDEAAVGYSMSIVTGIAGMAGALVLANGLKHYRITLRHVESLA